MARLYPYPTLAADLNLTITKMLVDGNRPAVQPVDPNARIIDLHGLNKEAWTYITLQVRIEAVSDEVRALEAEGTEIRTTLVAYNPDAEMRQTVVLTRGERASSIWTGKIELERVNFRGKVALRAIATGTIDGIDNRFLAESAPWSVWIDEPPTPIIEGTLHVEWRDFTKTEDRPTVIDKAYSDQIFFTDLVSDVPTVFLNKGLKGLPQLLAKPPADVGQRALHDAEMIAIASAVWLAMFHASAAAIEDSGDGEPVWPSVDWQERVLRLLLPRVYDCGPEEALAKLVEDLQTAEGASDLASRAQAAVAAQLKSAKRLARSIKALDVLETVEETDV